MLFDQTDWLFIKYMLNERVHRTSCNASSSIVKRINWIVFYNLNLQFIIYEMFNSK